MVSLAFYLPTGDNENEVPTIQDAYAFLPTRKFGLKFVVQVCNHGMPTSNKHCVGLLIAQ